MEKPVGKYSDSELYSKLRGSKKEAETAFAELYSRYSQRIYAYCLRVTGSQDDARDIFQETFTNFYNSSKNKERLENIPGYLITIARNQCINYKRNLKISVNIEDYNVFSTDTGYEQKELLELIARALELLDFEYREAFILRQYQGNELQGNLKNHRRFHYSSEKTGFGEQRKRSRIYLNHICRICRNKYIAG